MKTSLLVQTLCRTWILILVCSILPLSALADDAYAVKAALIHKISRFVTWPNTDQNNTFSICVAGNNPFSNHLEKLQQKMKNKDIHITYITKASLQLQTCDVVFISKSAKKTLALYLAQTATKPIFTISDIHGFAKSGGIVEITRRNSRLGFIFNMKSIQQSGLNIAAPLLQMSQRIEEENKHD